MTTLNEMQRQIERGFIGSPDDIRGILEHTLMESADRIGSIIDDWTGSIFKKIQEDGETTLPNNAEAVLLDVLVMEDWCSAHIREFGLVQQIRRDILKAARRDPWFTLFLDISVNYLAEFLRRQSNVRPSGNCNIKRAYRAVFDGALTDEVTIGGILNGMKKTVEKSWQVGSDIEEYQDGMLDCCRLVQSLIHMICSGYADVDARVSEDDYPYKRLKELLWEEAVSSERSETAGERSGRKIPG